MNIPESGLKFCLLNQEISVIAVLSQIVPGVNHTHRVQVAPGPLWVAGCQHDDDVVGLTTIRPGPAVEVCTDDHAWRWRIRQSCALSMAAVAVL